MPAPGTCPSLSPGVCSDLCPSSRWCHPAISSSVVPFSSCLQCSPASGSFPISQLFTSGCQIIGTSASASFLPMNMILPMISFGIHWFDLFVFQGTLKSLLYHHNLKASILWCSTFFKVQSSHQYFATRKTIALSIWTLVSKMMCLLFIFFNFILFLNFT